MSSSQLPAELWMKILNGLPIRDVLVCLQLSHTFHDLVDNDAILQYRLELALAGMADVASNTYSLDTKRAMLKRYQQARNTWEPSTVSTQTLALEYSGVDSSQLCDGILITDPAFGKLDLRLLQSSARDIPNRQWQVDLGFNTLFVLDELEVLAVVMDMSQDFLACAYLQNGVNYHIRLKRISTHERHPLTANELIRVPVPRTNPDQIFIDLHVLEKNLAALAKSYSYFGEESNQLTVWNWQTGSIILSMDRQDVFSIKFLSARHLLLTCNTKRSSCLCVATLSDLHPDPITLVSFRLPAPPHDDSDSELGGRPDHEPNTLCHFEVICHYPLLWACHGFSQLPFRHALEESIITLEIYDKRMASHVAYLIVPSWKLISYVDGHDPHDVSGISLDWEDWGPTWTRMLPGNRRVDRFSLYTGGRYACVEDGFATFYDFNRFAVPHAIANGLDSSNGGNGQLISDISTFNSYLFRDSVITSLPYIKYTTCISLSPSDYKISGDCIVVKDATKKELVIRSI